MVCQVSADVSQRIRNELDATRDDDTSGEGAKNEARVRIDATPGTYPSHETRVSSSLVDVPARVCPASESVPQHKDKMDGKGACVSGWICVIYLTKHPDSVLVLTDDVTGREFRISIEPGRLCRWPNARFSHRIDVDENVVEAEESMVVPGTKGCESLGAKCRYMIGPMAFNQASKGSTEIVYTEGGEGVSDGGAGHGGGGMGCGCWCIIGIKAVLILITIIVANVRK